MIEYLSPLSPNVLEYLEDLPIGTLGKEVEVYAGESALPNLENVKIAIIGVKENRADPNALESELDFDAYRKAFYALYPGNWSNKIADLGDIEKGESIQDTRFALKEVVSTLLKNNIIPLILGGSQDLTYAQYRAYDGMGEMISVVNVDNRFDLGNADLPITNKSFVSKMIVDQPYNLYNYSVLGYQSFFNPPQEIKLMEKLFFDACRLGEIKNDLSIVEPIMRDANMVSVDVSAIKNSELNYGNRANPNGFDGIDICAISRYAGISNKISSFGIYELQSQLETKSGAMLIAQIIWYFIEGYNFRMEDEDFDNESLYTSYNVPVDEHVLVFKKSNKTDRWWIEMPFISNVNNKLKCSSLLSCTKADYLSACDQEIPERWHKARSKNEMN